MQEERQLQNSTRKDFGMRVVTCPGWQVSGVGHLGWRVQNIRVHTDFSYLHSPPCVTSYPLKASFHDELLWSFILQNWSGRNMNSCYSQFMTFLYFFNMEKFYRNYIYTGFVFSESTSNNDVSCIWKGFCNFCFQNFFVVNLIMLF